MSDLRDLHDLARDVRDRVVIPPYDELSRRVRARRLRGAAGSVAAVVLLVGGVAVWQNLATTTASPIQPGDRTQSPDASPLPPTDESLWRQVVDGTDSHPFETQGADDGSIAVVWRALEQPEPTFALVIREADGTVHGRRIVEPVDLTPVPGGWVGVRTARAWFIASDGSWTELDAPGHPRRSRPGDVFVHGQYGFNMLYSPAEQSLTSMPQLYGDVADGYVTPDGELVTCGRGQNGVVLTLGDELGPSVPGVTCVLAGHGGDVTMVGLGDDPDGGIPMTGLVITHGNQVILPRMIDMLDGVTSVVVTRGGSSVITDASTGEWYLIDPDGDFRDQLGTDRRGEAFVSGDRLYVSSYGFMNGPLFYSEDDGHTWHQTVLPGNEE